MGFTDLNKEPDIVEKAHSEGTSIGPQNLELLKMVNKLHEKKAWFDPVEYARILSDITELMLAYFKTEEEYMEEYAYNDSEKHKNDHLNFSNQVIELNRNIKNKTSINAWQAYQLIIGLLVNHELQFGIKFKKFIHKKMDLGTLDLKEKKGESITVGMKY